MFIIITPAQSSTRQNGYVTIFFFKTQLCFCLKSERKFNQVAQDSSQKDRKIHIKGPEN